MRPSTQTSSNPQSDFIRAGRGDATRWASTYLISRQLDSDSSPTQHGIPVYVFRLSSLSGTLQKELNAVPEERRYQRMCVLCSLPLIPPTDAWPLTVSPSGSLCLASPFRCALPFPIPLLSHHHLMRPLPPLHLHHHRHRHRSSRRRRSSTSAVSPLA